MLSKKVAAAALSAAALWWSCGAANAATVSAHDPDSVITAR